MVQDNYSVLQENVIVGEQLAVPEKPETISGEIVKQAVLGIPSTSACVSCVVGASAGIVGTILLISVFGVLSGSALAAFLPLIMGVFLGGIGVLLGSMFDLESFMKTALDSLARFDDRLHAERTN